MLVGLLLPAVNYAREAARRTQCINNQKELGLAVINYEAMKKRLPGYANLVHGTQESWVPVLFPFLTLMDLLGRRDRMAAGKHGRMPRATSIIPSTIQRLVCPDDDNAAANAHLSYVANCGLYNICPPGSCVHCSPTPPPTRGVFRDYSTGSNGAISFSDVKSPTQTVMISENTFLSHRTWNVPVPPATTVTIANVGFLWPDTTVPAVHGTIDWARISEYKTATSSIASLAVKPSGCSDRHLLRRPRGID